VDSVIQEDNKRYYTGVGSRKTPTHILDIMTKLATKLAENHYILRSGGAIGADKAFEYGAGIKKEIYLAHMATTESMEIASQFHPAWNNCSPYAKKLHGRNSFQVLGPNLNIPSKFLICWTPDGCISHKERNRLTGGTGTAISIADMYNVPIFNLAKKDHLDRILRYIKK